jgi:hypothetical protein
MSLPVVVVILSVCLADCVLLSVSVSVCVCLRIEGGPAGISDCNGAFTNTCFGPLEKYILGWSVSPFLLSYKLNY